MKREKPETADREEAPAPNRGQFRKGQSGCPAGRPIGARNRATVAMQVMFEAEAEAISRVCVERALAGDPVALRLVVERLLSPARERTVKLSMPVLTTVADLPPSVASLLQSVAAGEITPSEGEKLAALLTVWRQSTELVTLEQRLAALEESANAKP